MAQKETLILQYTNKRQKKLIREAISLKDKREARKKKWKYLGAGYTASAYKKGSIVVKFFSEDRKEYLRHSKKVYLNYIRKYRKHMARIFYFGEDRIVQRYVRIPPKKSWTAKQIQEADDLVEKIGLEDVWPPDLSGYDGPHNIGIYKGKPILFDFTHEYI